MPSVVKYLQCALVTSLYLHLYLASLWAITIYLAGKSTFEYYVNVTHISLFHKGTKVIVEIGACVIVHKEEKAWDHL